MLFIKLIRIIAVVLAVGLVYHILYPAGKKNQSKPRRRKFVKSSVIRKNDEESDKEDS